MNSEVKNRFERQRQKKIIEIGFDSETHKRCTCDKIIPIEERIDFYPCDGCGVTDCKHHIISISDYTIEADEEMFYCVDCLKKCLARYEIKMMRLQREYQLEMDNIGREINAINNYIKEIENGHTGNN